MRRFILAAALTAASVLAFAGTASAGTPGAGWFRSPNPPFDEAAGAECAFAVHVAPIVDQVYGKTLDTFADGTPQKQIYAGPLIDRVTNTDNGRSYVANASGTAVITYGIDGSQMWDVVGPVLIGSKANSGNLPQGLWIIDGTYRIVFAANGQKTVTLIHGKETNICDR